MGETVSYKMKNVSYFPNHDTLIRNLNCEEGINQHYKIELVISISANVNVNIN